MRFSYNIYPNALKKIQEFGLEDRLFKLKQSENDPGYIGGHVSEMDIEQSVKWLSKEGYYKHIPEDLKKTYMGTMNKMLSNPEQFFWNIERNSGIEREEYNFSDMRLFTGEIASHILSPDELWDYKKFGFSNPIEFIGTVSAYIVMASRSKTGEGYIWTRKREDGSEIVTEITGDHNADLRVKQTDIAPYKTLDPFGNSVEFRPVTSKDSIWMSPYHSTEPSLLVAALTYIEQENIKTNFYEDKGQQLVDWANTISHGLATCVEHHSHSSENMDLLLLNMLYPIPKLDESYSTTKISIHTIPCMGEGWYSAYIAPDNKLIFSYTNKNNYTDLIKIPHITFTPDDAEEIVKGVIYQSAKNLGRTSVYTIVNMLKYRFSEEFEQRRDEYLKKYPEIS
ncbi:MAG: hypothetical protein ACP5N1_03585 [Candidatus Woesearchaeota archaeon]